MSIIEVPRLRDRRIAASDINSNIHTRRYNVLNTIILHQTVSPSFLPLRSSQAAEMNDGEILEYNRSLRYPLNPNDDENISSNHRIDRILTHFIVMGDGTIFYTHDVDRLSGSAGGRHGIDIEFAGTFSDSSRLSREAILSGRELIRGLKASIPGIRHIHPHGQVQIKLMSGVLCDMDRATPAPMCGKFHSCPGPDIWVNVGIWATKSEGDGGLGLDCDNPVYPYRNNTISSAQLDPSFERDSSFLAIPSNPLGRSLNRMFK